jgi:hypothetical protein
MLNVYKVMSENIIAAIAVNGEAVMKQPLIKGMRVIKKETLKLISDWVSRSSDHGMVSKTSNIYIVEISGRNITNHITVKMWLL